MTDQLNEIAAALCAAQAELKTAAMSGKNPHFQSKYADLADIWAACREPLTKNGLSVAQLPVSDDAGRIGMTTVLLHKSGQSITSTFYVTPQQNTPQGVGSALTYLRRYGLAAMVGIVADADDDGQAASAVVRRSEVKAAARAAVEAGDAPIPPAPKNGAPVPGPAPIIPSDRDMAMKRWAAVWNEAQKLGVVKAHNIKAVAGSDDATAILRRIAEVEKLNAEARKAQAPA